MKYKEFEAMGDIHKQFEKLNKRYLMEGLPTVVRLDGRAFHTFTKGLERPFDKHMSDAMIETAKYLVEQFNLVVSFVQSDEISGILPDTLIFGGSVDKINSVFAATATAKFNQIIAKTMPQSKVDMLPVFDCRVMQYPTKDLAVQNLAWREADATRNSVTMAAHAYYSHHELHEVGTARKHDMLMAKGINWNDYPTHFKRGTYIAKRNILKLIEDFVWDKIPEKNRPISRYVLRSVITELDLPPVSKITNLVGVIFEGDTPVCQ